MTVRPFSGSDAPEPAAPSLFFPVIARRPLRGMRSLAALDSAPAPATHRTLSHAEFLEKLDRIRAMAKPRGKDLLHSRAAYYLDDEQLAAHLAGEGF